MQLHFAGPDVTSNFCRRGVLRSLPTRTSDLRATLHLSIMFRHIDSARGDVSSLWQQSSEKFREELMRMYVLLGKFIYRS